MASSAAAFVEGGVQEACEDACSICLECFTDPDPAVVTCCKHEYHLQCIIEWSQRSKECPMCWQTLSLKDPDSQDLLAAVEQERSIRNSRINLSGVFPPEGYELHRISYGDDSDFEERMMRHLAFVTMGRRQLGRRDGNTAGVRANYGNMASQFVIVPAHTNTPTNTVSVPAGSLSLSPADTTSPEGSPNTPDSGSSSVPDRSRGSPRLSSEGTRRTSPTEMHSFSETLKSRLAAASSRYKESLTKTTKSFRDKLRMRNGTTIADIGARAREVSAGVVRALERISLESPESRESPEREEGDSETVVGGENVSVKHETVVGGEDDKTVVGGEDLSVKHETGVGETTTNIEKNSNDNSRGGVHNSGLGKVVSTTGTGSCLEERLPKVPACASS